MNMDSSEMAADSQGGGEGVPVSTQLVDGGNGGGDNREAEALQQEGGGREVQQAGGEEMQQQQGVRGLEDGLNQPMLQEGEEANGEGGAGGEEEEQESDEDDDDFVVTIGEIKETVPYSMRSNAAGVVVGGAGGGGGGGAGAGKLELDGEPPMIKGTPIYDMDLASMDELPWRKPGADITDYFNYGFNEDTWNQYCERQRKLRHEYNGNQAEANKALFSSITLPQSQAPQVNNGASGGGGRQLVDLVGANLQSKKMAPIPIMRTVITLPSRIADNSAMTMVVGREDEGKASEGAEGVSSTTQGSTGGGGGVIDSSATGGNMQALTQIRSFTNQFKPNVPPPMPITIKQEECPPGAEGISSTTTSTHGGGGLAGGIAQSVGGGGSSIGGDVSASGTPLPQQIRSFMNQFNPNVPPPGVNLSSLLGAIPSQPPISNVPFLGFVGFQGNAATGGGPISSSIPTSTPIVGGGHGSFNRPPSSHHRPHHFPASSARPRDDDPPGVGGSSDVLPPGTETSRSRSSKTLDYIPHAHRHSIINYRKPTGSDEDSEDESHRRSKRRKRTSRSRSPIAVSSSSTRRRRDEKRLSTTSTTTRKPIYEVSPRRESSSGVGKSESKRKSEGGERAGGGRNEKEPSEERRKRKSDRGEKETEEERRKRKERQKSAEKDK